jgi:hypothetical protein|tara:strand:- start:198 stop:470 length:273 start_codon:yes stop_codon:yes gene_type:complete
MKLINIFRDKNDLNEKTIVGFLSFGMMCFISISDVIAGLYGKEFVVSPVIFKSFLILTLGAFGIAEVGKIFKKDIKPVDPIQPTENNIKL